MEHRDSMAGYAEVVVDHGDRKSAPSPLMLLLVVDMRERISQRRNFRTTLGLCFWVCEILARACIRSSARPPYRAVGRRTRSTSLTEPFPPESVLWVVGRICGRACQ